jgi:hypothetical protein
VLTPAGPPGIAPPAGLASRGCSSGADGHIRYATAVKIDAMTSLGEFRKAAPKATGGDA